MLLISHFTQSYPALKHKHYAQHFGKHSVETVVVGVQPADIAELNEDCQQFLDSKRQCSNQSNTSLLTHTDSGKLAAAQKLLQTLAEESGPGERLIRLI